MSWAMRRRIIYLVGVFLFFTVIFGFPVAYHFLSVPPTCDDGELNQNETAPDRGGPCPLVDTNRLAPSSVLWTRAFKIRDGSYSAVSYIQNPNDHAGIAKISYIFSLYDTDNVLVTERTGETYIMSGGITPVFESDIDTGQRDAQRAFFKFTSEAVWMNYDDTSKVLLINNRKLTDESTTPRLEATVTNRDTVSRTDIKFVAVVFDTAGNALASSATHLDRLEPGASTQIVFTWPTPFALAVGRTDILPVTALKKAWSAPCDLINAEIKCAY